MVTTRRGDYITPEKNPPAPSNVLLHCAGPATRRKRPRPRSRRARPSQRQLITLPHLHSERGNDDTGGDDRGMNDDDGGDDSDNEGEQQVKEERGEAWERVTKKHKSQMSNDELRNYFDSHLGGVGLRR